jgi:hypothetical protein
MIFLLVSIVLLLLAGAVLRLRDRRIERSRRFRQMPPPPWWGRR